MFVQMRPAWDLFALGCVSLRARTGRDRQFARPGRSGRAVSEAPCRRRRLPRGGCRRPGAWPALRCRRRAPSATRTRLCSDTRSTACVSASLQDPLSFGLGVGDDLVAVLGQAAGGFELVRNGHADLIEDVEDLLLVDERARREWQARACAEHFLELVEQIQDVHGFTITDRLAVVSRCRRQVSRLYRLMRVRPWRRVCVSGSSPTVEGGSAPGGLLEHDHARRQQQPWSRQRFDRCVAGRPRPRTADRQTPGRPASARCAARRPLAPGVPRARSATSALSRLAWMMRDRGAVALDEFGRPGAAAERLDAQPARAGEQVEHARPGQRRGQVAVFVWLEAALVGQRFEHRENGALDQVGRWPRAAPPRAAVRPRALPEMTRIAQLGSPEWATKSARCARSAACSG